MIHIIIFLHFMCFAFGIGFITLSRLIYKKHNSTLMRDVVIGECIFAAIFLMDTIGVYIRRILDQYKVDNIFRILNCILIIACAESVYKIALHIKKDNLLKKLNIYSKAIIGIIAAVCILFFISHKYQPLQGVPYLCFIYLLQCILGIVCIKDVKNEKSAAEEKIQIQSLTPREREIVDYICMGLTNKEIGEKLFISANTVKNHVYNIYKKLDVKNKVDLINLVNKRN